MTRSLVVDNGYIKTRYGKYKVYNIDEIRGGVIIESIEDGKLEYIPRRLLEQIMADDDTDDKE